MAARGTEGLNDQARGLDTRPPREVLALLSSAQQQAAKSVDGAIEAIATASQVAADAVSTGRKLVYAGAGSSGPGDPRRPGSPRHRPGGRTGR